MKKNLAAIFAAGACLLSTLCLYQVSSLQRNLDQSTDNLYSAIHNMSFQIDNISNSVYNALEQEASLLADSRWEYGRLNLETRTVPVYLFLTPKTVTPGVTTATIFRNGDPISLTLIEDGVFGATLHLDLFAQEQLTRVVFTEGDTQKIQALDWYFYPREDFLPAFQSCVSYGTRAQGEDTVALEISSASLADIRKPRFSPTLLSAQLVEYWGEEEKGRYPLDEVDLSGRMIRLDRPLDLTLTYPQDQDYKLYLEITDEWGFHYQTPVHSNRSDNDYPSDRILDDDGNVIFAEKTW